MSDSTEAKYTEAIQDECGWCGELFDETKLNGYGLCRDCATKLKMEDDE